MLKSLINKALIAVNTKVKNRKELFELIAEKALSKDFITEKELFIEDLMEREKQGSTELQKGIAIPHTRSKSVKKEFIFVATSQKGIKFSDFALKGSVKLLFCIGTPPDNKQYINVLARIARLLQKQEFKDRLLKCDVPEDIEQLISEYERLEYSPMKLKDSKEFHLILLTVNNTEKSQEILQLFIELGIANPTIVDSIYGIRKLLYDIPFFGGFILGKDKTSASNIIMGITDNEKITAQLAGALKNEGIDLNKKGEGMLFSIKISNVFGGFDEDIDF